ncbi:MAG TPA: ArgE/DapE family deacylase [Deltaproteobacteria bacterium]|nr:ArgE/DapE family deacylase [Deltaproteobacteria bacterium]
MNEIIKNKILSSIHRDKNDIVQFTKDLVAVATENPPGNHYKPCVDLIENKLFEIGLDCEIIEVPESESLKRYCIVSSYGAGEDTLYFHGHYDVVPASSNKQFNPLIKSGKLYGRGSADMKSGLAAMIYAVKAIKNAETDLKGSIGLTLVPDEETGGILGSQYLSERGILGRNGIGMLTPEPTSGVVWNANRGAISFKITINGKPAHVGLQHEGINAFEKMLPLANALLELKEEVESRVTRYSVQPDSARHSILMMGGQSGGGSNFNLVPGEFSFTLDRRINPEEELETEKQKLVDVIETIRDEGIDLEYQIFQEGYSSGVREDIPLARALVSNIETVMGKPPEFEMCPGLLEIRFYAQKGIPAFAYGPGLLTVSHGPDEYVEIDNIMKHTAIYAFTALDMLE